MMDIDDLYDLHSDIQDLRAAKKESTSQVMRVLADFALSIERHEEVLGWAISRITELEAPDEAPMTYAQAWQRAEEELESRAVSVYQRRVFLRRFTVIEGTEYNVRFYTRGIKTTCVLVSADGRVRRVGRSWCGPDDIYHQAVGKLIAFHRALAEEVPAWLLHIKQPGGDDE